MGKASAQTTLPPALLALERFLRTATSFGTEIAFWRSHAQLETLRQASAELHSILLNPQFFELPEPNRSGVQSALENLETALSALKQAVPFKTRVGAIRRSLMPAYQEIFIVDHLLLAVIARMRMSAPHGREHPPRAGSLLDLETKREAAQALAPALPFWRKEVWNVYDYL